MFKELACIGLSTTSGIYTYVGLLENEPVYLGVAVFSGLMTLCIAIIK